MHLKGLKRWIIKIEYNKFKSWGTKIKFKLFLFLNFKVPNISLLKPHEPKIEIKLRSKKLEVFSFENPITKYELHSIFID